MSHWDIGRQPDEEQDLPFQPDLMPGAGGARPPQGWGPSDDTAEDLWEADGYWPSGGTPDGLQAAGGLEAHPQAAGAGGWPAAGPGGPGARCPRRGGRRWLVLTGVVAAAVGAGVILLANRSPASRGGAAASAGAASSAARASGHPSPSSSPSPAAAAAPLTLAQARAVVARYTTVNNNANAQRSDALLATVETASSYAIDAGSYLFRQGTAPYPPFSPARATYYVPRDEPAGGPRWFAVQVGNAFTSNPQKVTSSEYLLFTQQAPGGPWQDAAEPYLLPGVSPPQVAVGDDGLATPVSAAAASLAVAPGQLAADTAASLDGTGQPVIAVPGNLADTGDRQFWQGRLPAGTVTDTHAPYAGTGQELALRTAGGGALVLYADAAQLTITAPAGATFRLTVPGFYSASQALTRAGMTYLEQFAAYDPPAGGKAPRVVADYSGITGKD